MHLVYPPSHIIDKRKLKKDYSNNVMRSKKAYPFSEIYSSPRRIVLDDITNKEYKHNRHPSVSDIGNLLFVRCLMAILIGVALMSGL